MRFFRSIALAWILALPMSATAQQSADEMARAHFSSASAYYEQGRYEDAARAFMEAYRLSPRAELLDNAARAYERALLFDEAIQVLRDMRTTHPEYRDEATINERVASLERLRERVRSGGGGGGGDTAPPPDESRPPPPRASGGGGGVSIPGIAVLAAGGAIGLVSIITGAVSHTMYEEISDECDDGVCPSSRQGDIDTGNALAITSTVTMFVSIAAIAVGIVLLIVDTGGGGGGERADVELAPGPGDAGLAMQVRF